MKTAVVTGGASGIGQAIAHRLGADGHHVATIDLQPSEADFAYTADVTDRAQVDAALGKIRTQLGPVSILVNAAGLEGFSRFTDITFDQWQRVLNVNLNGVFHCCQAVIPEMVDAGWGRIVNISSSSTHSGVAGMAHYVAAKSAVNGSDQVAGAGVRPERDHRQRGAARLHRHADAARRRRARRNGRREGDRDDAGWPDGAARGHRRRVRVPDFRGGRLHHRTDPRRQRRTEHLTHGR